MHPLNGREKTLCHWLYTGFLLVSGAVVFSILKITKFQQFGAACTPHFKGKVYLLGAEWVLGSEMATTPVGHWEWHQAQDQALCVAALSGFGTSFQMLRIWIVVLRDNQSHLLSPLSSTFAKSNLFPALCGCSCSPGSMFFTYFCTLVFILCSWLPVQLFYHVVYYFFHFWVFPHPSQGSQDGGWSLMIVKPCEANLW